MIGLRLLGILSLVAGCHLVFPHQGPGAPRPDAGKDADAARPDGIGRDRSNDCQHTGGCSSREEAGPSRDAAPGVDAGASNPDLLPPIDSVSPTDAAPPICSGCWSAKGCVLGADPTACGKGGSLCKDCSATPTASFCASGGECLSIGCQACSKTECCVGASCLTSNDQHCGRQGETCVVCLSNQACVLGRCIENPCGCGGCCESYGCYPGNNPQHCGPPGLPCEDCLSQGLSCSGGVCTK